MTGGEMAIVIEGTREDWPGGAITLTVREPTREPNGTFWFGAELGPAGVEARVTAHSGRVGLASELPSRGASTTDVMLAGTGRRAGWWRTTRPVRPPNAGLWRGNSDPTSRRLTPVFPFMGTDRRFSPMSGFSRKLVEVTLVVVATAIFGPVAVDACEFGAEVPQAIQEATCSITIRASGNAEAATFRWEVTREAAAMIGMVSAAEDGAVASEAFRAETRDIPYEVALGVVESLEEVMELLWAIHGDRFEEPEFLFPGLLVYYGSENIASAWLSPDDGEAAMLFYTNPLLRMRASPRGGSSGEPPPAGCGTYPPARRRRATSRLSFCARPNRRSSARTPHSSLRPTSYGASSSAWRRAGSPRPGWPQPPSAARRSAEPRASPAGRRSRGSCRRRSTP